MTSSIHSLSENSESDEEQQLSETQSHSSPSTNGFLNPGLTSPPMFPYAAPAHLGVGNAQTAYPYPDPYYRSIFAPYETQPYPPPPMAHLHLMGMQQQAGVPLPTDSLEEPVFVNAKQYHGILRRRQSRAKAELENKLAKSRKPYLHESRHLHALRRSRGVGGRFQKKKENQKNDLESNSKSRESMKPNGQDNESKKVPPPEL